MKKPEKVCVIGLDAALPHRIKKYMDEGVLPNFSKLINGGVFATNCLVPHPTITPPNWTTIGNGSWPGTHGITDFHVHKPGNDLSMKGCHQGFNRDDSVVENIWEAAERAGKKSIVFNFPASWPSRLKEGIVVGGNSNITNDWRHAGLPGTTGSFSLCADQIYSTFQFPKGGVKLEVEDADEWDNLPDDGDHMEAPIELTWRFAENEMEDLTWYLLLHEVEEGEYKKASLCTARDLNTALCTLEPKQWSPKLTVNVKTKAGEEKKASFRAKLIELSDDAETVTFYMTGLAEHGGFSSPAEVSEKLMDHYTEGDAALRGGGLTAFSSGWIDVDTYVEATDLQNTYLAECVEYMFENYEWDLFFMHAHAVDWIYHGFMTKLDPVTESDPEVVAKYTEAERQTYISVDKMIGRIAAAAGKKAMVVLVSDHGATADGVEVLPDILLKMAQEGLISVKEPEQPPEERELSYKEAAYKQEIDWSKTKAIAQRTVHMYVNLKGRDPEGIVEPGEEYEDIRQKIIDILMTHVDPKTGKRPFSLALRREDARPLGCYGDRVGDVIYAVYGWVGGQHGYHLPTTVWGEGSIKGLFAMSGPGIKKGVELERTIWITDLVPTICYLMDLPVPAAAEGAVVFQAFKDMNYRMKEMRKLKEGVERMKTAISRQEREPWDKHDCA